MPELSRYKRTAQIAKFLIPALARIFSSKHAQTALSLGETGVALLQGKGAGSGWDLGAEVTAVMPFIRAGATVFDVGANKGEWSRAIQDRVGKVRLFLFEPQAMCVYYRKIDGGGQTQAAVGETDGRCGRQCFASRKKRYPFRPATVQVERGRCGLNRLVHGSPRCRVG